MSFEKMRDEITIKIQKKLKEEGDTADVTDATNAIHEAMDRIEEAQDLVDSALAGTELENHYEAYGRYGFDQLLGNGNPHDGSLPKLIEEMKESAE